MDRDRMGIRSGSPIRNFDFSSTALRSPSRHNMLSWRISTDDLSKPEPESTFIQDGRAQKWNQPQQPQARRVAVGLPRQATFRRQNSEKHERLYSIPASLAERRVLSSTRRKSLSASRPRKALSPQPGNLARSSDPIIPSCHNQDGNRAGENGINRSAPVADYNLETEMSSTQFRPPRPPSQTSSNDSYEHYDPDGQAQLNAELDSKWILNLSMHFRDNSDREKFFVTYAAQPNRWRRVTISCDYRNAEAGSLEMDLKELSFQRDKNMQIYESIRDSLPDIQFYDTVTNLKLVTSDNRLHVHVTEDVNEIIPYPPRATVGHILDASCSSPKEVRESDLKFESHLSGFVYKVRWNGQEYIKKEIPGPDTVDEFLYEINALHALRGSECVIQLEAIVLDDSCQIVKGLLISYAERGAIVDLLYDHKGSIPLDDRLRWAQQSIKGLSEIHGEGYVQGDFTLSNIVVDSEDNAKIIDINRRGCPVGWEPPELAKKIASHQRISMYIGEKSDLYQLGMTLWGLAMDDDEPERHDHPLEVEDLPIGVPDWYRDIVRTCLSPEPRDRKSAKELLTLFPQQPESADHSVLESRPTLALRNAKRYIHPDAAVERGDIERMRRDSVDTDEMAWTSTSSVNDYTFTYPRSSNYENGSELSYVGRPRDRHMPGSPMRDRPQSHIRERLSGEQARLVADHELHPNSLVEGRAHDGDRNSSELEQNHTDYPNEISTTQEIAPDQSTSIAGLERDIERKDLEHVPSGSQDPTFLQTFNSSVLAPTKPAETGPSSSSPTSEDTPRDTRSPATQPSISSPDTSIAELIGMGANPELEQYNRPEAQQSDILTPATSEHDTNLTEQTEVTIASHSDFADYTDLEPTAFSAAAENLDIIPNDNIALSYEPQLSREQHGKDDNLLNSAISLPAIDIGLFHPFEHAQASNFTGTDAGLSNCQSRTPSSSHEAPQYTLEPQQHGSPSDHDLVAPNDTTHELMTIDKIDNKAIQQDQPSPTHPEFSDL